MNLPTKQSRGHREQACGFHGRGGAGEGWIGRLQDG